MADTIMDWVTPASGYQNSAVWDCRVDYISQLRSGAAIYWGGLLFGAPVTSSYTGHFKIDFAGLKIGHDHFAKPIIFQINGAAKLHIASDGRVGVDKVPGNAKLDVNGNLAAECFYQQGVPWCGNDTPVYASQLLVPGQGSVQTILDALMARAVALENALPYKADSSVSYNTAELNDRLYPKSALYTAAQIFAKFRTKAQSDERYASAIG